MNIIPIVADASVFQVPGRVYNHAVDARNDHTIMGQYSSAGNVVGVDVTASAVTSANTNHNLWSAYCLPTSGVFKPSTTYQEAHNFRNVAQSATYTFNLGPNVYRTYQIWFSTNSARAGSLGRTLTVHATVWCIQN